MGSGPAVDLASLRRVEECDAMSSPSKLKGLILHSPFESAVRTQSYGASFFTDYFENHNKIAAVQCPVAIIHSDADAVCPFSGAQALFSKLREPYPPKWLEGYG